MRKAIFTLLLAATVSVYASAQKIEFTTAMFRTGDDASWSSPKLDESDWKEVSIKGNDQSGAVKEENSTAWYRVHFQMTSKVRKDAVVLIYFGYTDDADEAFLNGRKIGGSGRYDKPSVYKVPVDALNLKGDNVLAVKLYNRGGSGGVIETKTRWKPYGKYIEVIDDPAERIIAMTQDVPSTKININEIANYRRYADSDKTLGKPADGEHRVILYGDSITDRWASMRKSFFNDNNLIGRGISGETSAQFLLRFQNDVIELQPSVVVLNYGTNDIAENTGAYSEDQTFNNVKAMCGMAKAAGAKVVLASTLPHGGFLWNTSITDAMSKVRSLNARVKAYAEAEGFTYVDYFSAMVSADGTCMDKSLSTDGVHPNPAGYDIMESIILPVIQSLH